MVDITSGFSSLIGSLGSTGFMLLLAVLTIGAYMFYKRNWGFPISLTIDALMGNTINTYRDKGRIEQRRIITDTGVETQQRLLIQSTADYANPTELTHYYKLGEKLHNVRLLRLGRNIYFPIRFFNNKLIAKVKQFKPEMVEVIVEEKGVAKDGKEILIQKKVWRPVLNTDGTIKLMVDEKSRQPIQFEEDFTLFDADLILTKDGFVKEMPHMVTEESYKIAEFVAQNEMFINKSFANKNFLERYQGFLIIFVAILGAAILFKVQGDRLAAMFSSVSSMQSSQEVVASYLAEASRNMAVYASRMGLTNGTVVSSPPF